MTASDAPIDELAGIAAVATRGCEPELFRRARQAYDSPGRHYHAWSHIEACLREFALQDFDEPRAVLLALLFHDAVYVAGRKDNESRSAALAEALIARHCDATPQERQAVTELILLTASHHAHDGLSPDAARLIDIDLAVLGDAWPVYRAYADGVRREFCPSAVSPQAFVAGRSKFLRGLLGEPQLYATEWMRARREAQARSNIARELDELAHAQGAS
jgi:predicted metal-dependent HD superfamily phosphohydrolase